MAATGKMMMKVLCVVLACMVVATPYAEAAITCSQVVGLLAPCFTYLRVGGPVADACCSGVKGLNDAAQSTLDRKTACICVTGAYASISGIKAINASGLPGKCGVSLPYKISPNTDCSKVQ